MNHFFCAFMDCKQQTFVDFEVVSKSFGSQKRFIDYFEGRVKQWSFVFYGSSSIDGMGRKDSNLCA
jgi:hypothetical protein